MLLELKTGQAEPHFVPDLRGADGVLPKLIVGDTPRAVTEQRDQVAVRMEHANNSFNVRYGLAQPHTPVNGIFDSRDWAEFHWYLWVLGIRDDQLRAIKDWKHCGGWDLDYLIWCLEHPSVYFGGGAYPHGGKWKACPPHPGGYVRHKQNLAKVKTKPSAVHVDIKGLVFIEGFEGFSGTWYDDGTGVQTIGYGHIRADGPVNAPITQAQGQALLKRDIIPYENDVKRLVHRALTGNQFDALVSFDYNLGPGNTAQIAPLINAGNFKRAGDVMLEFSNPGDPAVHEGLLRRRKAERALLLS